MDKLDIRYTANAGVLISYRDKNILIDALHDRKTERFSTLSSDKVNLLRSMDIFSNIHAMIVTHKHSDHYSPSLVSEWLLRNPDAILFMPELEYHNQVALSGREVTITQNDMILRFWRLKHDGKEYADDQNYGCLLKFSGMTVLVLGDCMVNEPTLAEFIKDEKIDAAFLNFPWITLSRGRDTIRELIKPKHLRIFHLPFPEDDTHRYLESTRRSADKLEDIISDIVIYSKFLQEDSISNMYEGVRHEI